MDKQDTLAGAGLDQADQEILDLVEIEEYGKKNQKPPKAKKYRIRIDKAKYEVGVPRMTGRQLLLLAGKTPPERYTISQKIHGGQAKTIGLDEEADFTAPGVERFMTLPLDQQEGWDAPTVQTPRR
jgi:hypothetical protein